MWNKSLAASDILAQNDLSKFLREIIKNLDGEKLVIQTKLLKLCNFFDQFNPSNDTEIDKFHAKIPVQQPIINYLHF